MHGVQSNSNIWTKSIKVNEWVITFKIDIGADVTIEHISQICNTSEGETTEQNSCG